MVAVVDTFSKIVPVDNAPFVGPLVGCETAQECFEATDLAADGLDGRVTANEDAIDLGPTALLWDDVFGDISQGTSAAALTYEAFRDTSFLMYFMRHNQADALYFRYQLPHRWNKGAVRPHLHYVPMANGAGKFAVSGKYVWVNYLSEVPADAGWTSYSASKDLVAGDQYDEQILGLGSFAPPAGSKESAILLITCIRNMDNDTYDTGKDHGTAAANIGLLSMDAHYQSEKSGTVTEYP